MLNTILGILILVMSVFLVVTILLQSSKDHRMSGTIAGGAETFFGKQKGKTIDGFLNKLTVVVCILFFVVVLVMYIAQPNPETNYINYDDIIVEDEVAGEVTDETAEDTTVTDETADATAEDAVDAEVPADETAEAVDEAETSEETTEDAVELGDNEVSF